MNRISCRLLFLILSILFSSFMTISAVYGQKKDGTPFDFGLGNAKDGEDRYEILLKTHKAALAAGVNVNYTGIDTIKLEIPKKTSRIPLTQYNDFKGCVFVVPRRNVGCLTAGMKERLSRLTKNL